MWRCAGAPDLAQRGHWAATVADTGSSELSTSSMSGTLDLTLTLGPSHQQLESQASAYAVVVARAASDRRTAGDSAASQRLQPYNSTDLPSPPS